jgi:hypothetical protein
MSLPVFIRFKELKARGIVQSWAELKALIDNCGFPTGRLLGPQTRVWETGEVADWLASRPTEKGPLKGVAKAVVEAKAARLAKESEAA